MKKAKLKYILPAIAELLALLLIIGNGALYPRAVAFAASEDDIYTNVIGDLRIDENFNVEDYPAIKGDYSIKVIQIAESSDDELFIYTYQAGYQSRDLKASSINIGRTENNTANLDFPNYKLTFINSAGVFYKYRVEDFELQGTTVRYYNISNILRPYDKYIDGTGGQTVSEQKNAVGQLWEVVTFNGETVYSMTTSEVIEVTKKFVGFVNYDDGVKVGWGVTSGATSAHFVAFDTDKPIDHLLQADIYFQTSDVTYKQCNNPIHTGHAFGSKYDYNKTEPEKYTDLTTDKPYITLDYKQKVSAGKYEWDRIQTTEEFLTDLNNKNYEITNPDDVASIAGTKWVLNFYETEINAHGGDGIWLPLLSILTLPFISDVGVKYTEVSEVMILRLEFETAGEHYNLGVVDNKQTGDKKPTGVVNIGDNFALPIWAIILIAVIVIVIVIVIFLLLFPPAGAVVKGAIDNQILKTTVKQQRKRQKLQAEATNLNKPKRQHKKKKRNKRKSTRRRK